MTAEEIFEKTYAAYGPALYRFCLVQLGSPADAEDALQEVFCKRQCRDEHRRRGRRDLPLDESLPAPAKEYLGLWEQVAALPEKHRAAIHLHYGEGYSVEETAKILGATVSAVKMRLKRGREALRREWEDM